MSEELETWPPPEPTLFLRDLESGRIGPLMVDVVARSTGGSHVSAGTSRLEELQERLQSRTPESPASEVEPHTTLRDLDHSQVDERMAVMKPESVMRHVDAVSSRTNLLSKFLPSS